MSENVHFYFNIIRSGKKILVDIRYTIDVGPSMNTYIGFFILVYAKV